MRQCPYRNWTVLNRMGSPVWSIVIGSVGETRETEGQNI